MIGKLHLSAGRGAGLKDRGHHGERDRTAGPFSRRVEALLGGLQFPLGGASARADLAAAAERGRVPITNENPAGAAGLRLFAC